MGVDVRLYLYRSAEPREVATAMAILSGNDPNPSWVPSGGGGRFAGPEPAYYHGARSDKGFWVPRPKYELKATDFSFGAGTITFDSPVDPDNQFHYTMIHSIHEHGFGWLLGPKSTPYWIAVCRKLVDIFGGALDHNDCDSVENDYFRFERVRGEGGEGDNSYLDRQDLLLDLKALTPDEIEACRGFAAYYDVPSYHPVPAPVSDAGVLA